MTTIAVKNGVMAADSMSCTGSLRGVAQKIFRLSDGRIFGAAGNYASVLMFRNWLEAGADPEKYPASQKSEKDWCQAIVLDRSGLIVTYEQYPVAMPERVSYWAVGSGAEFAMAAMYCGLDAHDAVGVAIALDHKSGGGIETLTFN